MDTKLDTQSNKVLNHNQINTHKVMGLFCSLGLKFLNLSFWGRDVLKAAKSFLRLKFQATPLSTGCEGSFECV
jgi:hypothetical protein